MTKLLTTLAVVLCLFPTLTLAEFTGDLKLGPPGCEQQGECTLLSELRFRDPQGLEWLAAVNNKTDGASIPIWARPFIGHPFDVAFIKAAVVHDRYCDRHVRPWRTTHKMFYEALLELGVDPKKAKLMYYAVYAGGPKWVELIPGKYCGKNCVFRLEAGPFDSVNQPKRSSILARTSEYDRLGFLDELRAVERLLEENGERIDLEYLERHAENMRPNDLYYKLGDRLQIGAGGITE